MPLLRPHLTIGGLHDLPRILQKPDPQRPITHVISLWDPPVSDADQAEINRYLALFGHWLPDVPVLPLEFEDIAVPVGRLTPPAEEHLVSVLAFAREALAQSGENTHLLVHCFMGVSRSTACALAILAQANPKVAARKLFAHLLTRREWSFPNQRLTRFADQLLDRNDSLLDVVVAHRKGHDTSGD